MNMTRHCGVVHHDDVMIKIIHDCWFLLASTDKHSVSGTSNFTCPIYSSDACALCSNFWVLNTTVVVLSLGFALQPRQVYHMSHYRSTCRPGTCQLWQIMFELLSRSNAEVASQDAWLDKGWKSCYCSSTTTHSSSAYTGRTWKA
jgi:hypothetical protein